MISCARHSCVRHKAAPPTVKQDQSMVMYRISSTEFFQSTFDERNIREDLSGGWLCLQGNHTTSTRSRASTTTLPSASGTHSHQSPLPFIASPFLQSFPTHPRLGRITGTYPPALPKWEGSRSVDGCEDYPTISFILGWFGFSPCEASFRAWGTSYPKPFGRLRINSASGRRERG
jgi:hypothetical protein